MAFVADQVVPLHRVPECEGVGRHRLRGPKPLCLLPKVGTRAFVSGPEGASSGRVLAVQPGHHLAVEVGRSTHARYPELGLVLLKERERLRQDEPLGASEHLAPGRANQALAYARRGREHEHLTVGLRRPLQGVELHLSVLVEGEVVVGGPHLSATACLAR